MTKADTSPAAIRLKNARKCFSKLEKATKKGSVEEFSSTLNDMIASNPSPTSAIHSWRSQAFFNILHIPQEQIRLQKMALFIDRCPELPKENSYLVSQAVRYRCAGCIDLLLNAGHPPKLDASELGELIKPTVQGRWMHLDRIDPGHFYDSDRTLLLYREMRESLFDPKLYASGLGFFQPEFIEKLAKMNPPASIGATLRGAFVQVRLHEEMKDHPWAPGIALAVDKGLLTWDDMHHALRGSLTPYIEAAQIEFDHLCLSKSTPVSPRRASARL